MDKNKERSEDLNPGSNDIEERVKQMLDPSVPDEADEADEPKSAVAKPKAIKSKPIVIDTPEQAEGQSPLSAPILPADEPGASQPPKPSATKSKKVIIPISHHSDDGENTDGPTDSGPDEPEKPIAESDETTKLTLNDADASPADLAEKLDEAIAELEPSDKETTDVPETDQKEEAQATQSGSTAEPDEPDAVPVEDPEVLTDPETDKAVDAIIADESDKLLEVEDALRDTDEPIKAVKKQRRSLRQLLKALWAKPAFRWMTILVALALILGLGAYPSSRYMALNSVGVRAKSSLTILDASTLQPLKNVKVSIGDSSATTDVNGTVELKKVRLGTNSLLVEKRAFASVNKTIVVGWGSNPLGNFNLTPTGSQYSFTVVDYLSAKPIGKVEINSGDSASALSDDKGVVKLTVDKQDDQPLAVNIKGDNYRTEELSLDPNDKSAHTIKLVPSRKQVFVSKRSGKYDIYSVYVDGKNEKLVLAGSGKEKEDMVLVPHPTQDIVAYVSTRAGQTDTDGFVLSNLLIINTSDNTTTNVGASERIQVVGWSGNRVVYVKIAAGTSANSPKRYRLMSYDYKEENEKELASSNFFNDVIFAGGSIYYAPSSAYQSGPTNFYKINADGSGAQTVFSQEVWNIFRTSYDHLALSVQQQWYDYKLGTAQPAKLNAAPASQITRVYIDSPDGKRSAWVDNRDGKGVLLVYDIAAKTETDTTLRSQTGLTYPVQWLNDHVLVYRVKSPTETADYAISLDGGDPVKVKDVTDSGGIDRWYYY